MKRTSFLHVFSLALVGVLFLVSALAPAHPALAASDSPVVVTTERLNFRAGPGLDEKVLDILEDGQALGLLATSTDGEWARVQLADGSRGWVYSAYLALQGTVEGTVSEDALRLRMGPGLGYKPLRLLASGQELSILGLSVDHEWLEVRLPNGTGGWVSSDYVQVGAALAFLPVTEAHGGPFTPGQPTDPGSEGSQTGDNRPDYSVWVSIEDNQATVFINRFPARTNLSVSLGLPGEAPDLEVARGKTGANGQAEITFSMPSRWSDGSRVRETNLVITVDAIDGSRTTSVNILYYP